MVWTSGSLTLGSPAAVSGGTLNVPGTGYATIDASQFNATTFWIAISLQMPYAWNAMPTSYGFAAMVRKALSPSPLPDFTNYYQITYGSAEHVWFFGKPDGTAQSVVQSFAAGDTVVLFLWADGTNVYGKVGTQATVSAASTYVLSPVDAIDLLQGWQGQGNYLGNVGSPGKVNWVVYGSGAVPSDANFTTMNGFGATAPVHDDASWPASRRFVWRNQDGTTTWITSTDAAAPPSLDVALEIVATVPAPAVPVVIREILLDTQATDGARDGAYGANGGNGWGAMKQPIGLTSTGDVYVLVERLGAFNNVTNDPDYWAKVWYLFKITPSMGTSLTNPLFSTVGPFAGPFVSGRERPNLVIMPDDSVRVIGFHPRTDTYPGGVPGVNQDTLELEDQPYMWSSVTGLETQLPSTAGMSRAFWDVRWPYSAVMASGWHIWMAMNRQNQTVTDPAQGLIDVDYPGGYALTHSPNGGADWNGAQFHYDFIRSLYPFMFPRLDLGTGGVEFFTMPASQWSTFVAHSSFVQPNDGSTYMWNGLLYVRISDITVPNSSLPVDQLLFESQWNPPDHPQYEIVDAMQDANGVVHAIMTGWGSNWGGPNVGGADIVQIHPDGTGKLPVSPTVTRTNCPILFANQSRMFRGRDGVYWLIGGGSPYPIRSATQPNEIRYVQAAPGDVDGTNWRTYPGSPPYPDVNGYATFAFQIIPLQGQVGQQAYNAQNGSDRFHIANTRNGSAIDPNNHVHGTFGAGGLAWYVEVALPTSGSSGGISSQTFDVTLQIVASTAPHADVALEIVASLPVLVAGNFTVDIGSRYSMDLDIEQ